MNELADERESLGGWPAAVLLAGTFFVAIAPTLAWLEFGASMENLVVATSLEIRRTGNWLVPTLEGEPRVAKPPLAAWASAAAIRAQTFSDLDSPDPLLRSDAYRRLGWDTRWPGLAASCLMLLAIYDLGRTVAGVRCGIFALLIAGSTLYFFRFGRQTTTDVQLALWASVANAALVRMCLRGVTWRNAIAAGAALGLALMSKGPVTLLLNVLPVVIFVLWRRPWRGQRWGPRVGAAALLMLIIGVSWYVLVLAQHSEAWARWKIELSRIDPNKSSDSPFKYVSILLYMMPWTPLLVLSLIWGGMEAVKLARKREPWSGQERWLLMFLLAVVPVLLMSLFPDRKGRYLLPLLGPFAVLSVRALELTLQRDYRGPHIPAWVQWVIVSVMGIGLPIIGATRLALREDGQPWFAMNLAIGAALVFAAIILIGIVMSRRWPVALVGTSVIVLLLMQPLAYFGYRHTQSGSSDMRPLAEVIRQTHPTAEMYHWRADAKRGPVDLSIYLNRSTIWTTDPTALPPSQRPQISVKLQNRGQPEPQAPQGWQYLAKALRDEKDWYIAFVREAARGQ